MSSHASWVAIAVMSSLLLLWALASIVIALRHRSAARDAVVARRGIDRLREGATVVFGIVATDDDEPAITVTIDEHGKQWMHKGHWHHEWRETARDVAAQPFDVLTDLGERVRVEPSSDVQVVDGLEVTLNRPPRRQRAAKVVPGERVAVTGVLRRVGAGDGGGAYRGAAPSWILGPRGRAPMLVSTLPLDERHLVWARFFGAAALAPAFLLVATHVLVYAAFYDFALSGEPGTAVIVDRDHYRTHGRNAHDVWEVQTELPNGERAWFDVREDRYDDVGVGTVVRCVLTPSGRMMLGGEAGIDPGVVAIFLSITAIAAVAVLLTARKKRVWYEQRRVVTQGRGVLSAEVSDGLEPR